MGHEWSYREIRAAAKARRLLREQGRQMGNRTYRELLEYLQEGFASGRMSGCQPVTEDVVEFIHDGHMGVAEYLADKYGVGGERCGQDSPDRVCGHDRGDKGLKAQD